MPSLIRTIGHKIIHLLVLLSYVFHGVAPAFATSVMGTQDDCFYMVVKTSQYQKGNYAYPQITLTMVSGDECETTTITPFTPLHKMSGMRGLFDEQNRSLGFTYRAKTLGQMLICWDGSLLLHNLKIAAPHLRIETDGSLLLNGVSGGNVQLQGRDIYFNGTNRFDALSLSFNDQGATRMAQVLPKSALITQELSLNSGLLLNDGQVSVAAQSFMYGSHLVNEGTFETGTLQFDEKGTLKNKGTLKSTMITARCLENLENYGAITSDFEITSKRIINTGSIEGTGTMRAHSFTNEGVMGDEASVVRVGKHGVNLGILKAQRIGGGGHFKNHHKLQVQELSVREFTNEPDETLKVDATVEGESLHLTRHVRSFTNDVDASIEVNKLTMEKRKRNPRAITNRGHIKGKNGKAKNIKLRGTVTNTGEIEADDFTWEGDTFLNQSLEATKARLKGDTFTNRGNLDIGSGSMDVSEFINKGIATLTLKPSSYVSHVFNEGSLYLQGGMAIAKLDNAEQGKVRLSQGLSRRTSFNGDHFEQEAAQDITIGANNWISFSVEGELRDRHYNVGSLLDIRINNESYGGMIYENEIDHETGRVRVQFSNDSLPVILPNDRVRIYHQTPQIDFDIFTCNNDGQMDVLDVPLLVMISINNARSLVFKDSSLLSLTAKNRGTMTLDGTGDHRLMDLDNKGVLKFGVPVWLENAHKWQKPGRIEGAYGIHIPAESLNPLEDATLHLKENETLYLYGKNFKSTKDTEFNHNLSITSETFNNNHTLRAHDVWVDTTTTFDNRGTLISKRDMFLRTQHQSLLLNNPWLQVGRDLTMKLLNGALHVKDHWKFPGDVKVKAGSFTLKGSLEAAGDIDVETSGNITLEAVRQEIQTLELLLKDLERRTNDRGAFQSFIKHLSPAEEESVLFHLKRISGARVGAPQDLSLSQVLQWYGWSDVMRAIAEHLQLLTPLGGNPFSGPLGATEQRAPVHSFTLSQLKSKGHLNLKGQNINNLGGQVQGDYSLTLQALQNIINGSAYRTTRQDLNFHYTGGAPCLYSAPEERGNGSLLSTLGPLSLVSGFSIQNNHGIMFTGDDLSIRNPFFLNNTGGQIVVMGDAHLGGKSFNNTRAATIELKSNQTTQEYVGSGPAILQVLGNLTLDFNNQIINFASDIMVGGAEYLKRARILNNDLSVSIWATQPSGQKPTTGLVSAPSLIPTMSSNEMFTITTPQEVLNGGMISSPQININGPRLLQIGSQDSTPRSSPRSSIRTVGDADCIPLVPYVRQLGEDLRTIVGSLPCPQLPDITVVMDQNTRVTLSMPHLLSSPHIDALSLQRGYMEHYRKGYVFAHLSPIEHLIKLRDNARKMALQHGVKGPNWSPLMITEAEASKTSLPMLLYRLIIVNGEAVLSPEYWGPHDMINPFLLSNEPAVVGDEVFKSSDVHMTSVTGNVHGGDEVSMSGYDITVTPRIVTHTTPYGFYQTREGGVIETGPNEDTEITLDASNTCNIDGAHITAPRGDIGIRSQNAMRFGTVPTHSLHDDGETRREETLHHPTRVTGRNIGIQTFRPLSFAATQLNADETIRAEGSHIAMPSVVNTYDFQQRISDRDPFGGKSTRTEVSQSTTHQVVRATARSHINFIATRNNMEGVAPVFTAPKIVLDFPNGALLLQAFKNTYFHNVETFESNAFLNTHTTSGSSSTIHGGSEFNGDTSFTRGRPIHMEVPEHRQNDLEVENLRRQGATIHSVQDEFQSWEETKRSVGPGLSTVIGLGIAIIMPGIGTGVSGAILTQTAAQVSSRTAISLINNQGNLLDAFAELTTAESLKGIFLSSAQSLVTAQVGGLLGIPLHPTGTDFMQHAQSALLNAASRIAVDGVLNHGNFSEVVEGALKEMSASFVGTYGSAQIGAGVRANRITTLEQNLAHVAVGAASGALSNGDPLSGAFGAVIGENVGKHLRAELEESGLTEDHPHYEIEVDRAVNIARFTAASLACALGQDADVASFAAANAARHNALSYNPDLPSLDQAIRDAEHYVDDIVEGVKSFADTGEELAEAISDAVGLNNAIDRAAVSILGYGAGGLVGIGLNTASMIRGKGTKAPRGPRSKTTREARGAPSVETRSASNKRATPEASTQSNKRIARTEPEFIEPAVTPVWKSPRLANQKSPGASGGVKKVMRDPASIQDQMTMDAAKKGAGNRIMKNLDDPKFKDMEKIQYKVKSNAGKDSVVHYVRDPKTGKRMDFKFTKRSTDK